MTTHATELKLFAHADARRCERERALRPATRSRRPSARRRHARSVAGVSARARARHSPEIVERAESLLGSANATTKARSRNSPTLSAQLQTRARCARARACARRSLAGKPAPRTEALERERREFADRAEARLEEALREFSAGARAACAERAGRAAEGYTRAERAAAAHDRRDAARSWASSPKRRRARGSRNAIVRARRRGPRLLVRPRRYGYRRQRRYGAGGDRPDENGGAQDGCAAPRRRAASRP